MSAGSRTALDAKKCPRLDTKPLPEMLHHQKWTYHPSTSAAFRCHPYPHLLEASVVLRIVLITDFLVRPMEMSHVVLTQQATRRAPTAPTAVAASRENIPQGPCPRSHERHSSQRHPTASASRPRVTNASHGGTTPLHVPLHRERNFVPRKHCVSPRRTNENQARHPSPPAPWTSAKQNRRRPEPTGSFLTLSR